MLSIGLISLWYGQIQPLARLEIVTKYNNATGNVIWYDSGLNYHYTY